MTILLFKDQLHPLAVINQFKIIQFVFPNYNKYDKQSNLGFSYDSNHHLEL